MGIVQKGYNMKRIRTSSACVFGLALATLASTQATAGNLDFSLYSGYQGASNSDVSVTDGTAFSASWDGKSFDMPPYYGVRTTFWLTDYGLDSIGLVADYSHTKVYADAATMAATPGWTHFEFTDGLNLLTANVFYRHPISGTDFTIYGGLGAGINIPHVEVTRPSGMTSEYQVGGFTGQVTAGLDYKITDKVSLFSEYKFNYSQVDVSIDSGDRLKTDLATHAINIGLTYHF